MPKFRPALKCSDIPEGSGKRAVVKGERIALFRIQGIFYAINDTCPHREGPLSEGHLNGAVVACPWHGWTFDLHTGICRMNPNFKVRVYPVKVVKNQVHIQI